VLNPVTVTRNDVAFLQYTGGTTGLSKGAMLTRAATSLPTCFSRKPGCSPLLHNPRKPPPPEQLTVVCALPLYHIFALTVCSLLGAAHRRVESADPEPARYSGTDRGTGRKSGQRSFLRSIPCTTRWPTIRISQTWIIRI